MALHFTSHLHRNRYGIYGFRIVIPKDLRVSLPRKEIRISLRTSNKKTAQPRALRLKLVTIDHFARMRSVSSLDEAIAIGEAFLNELSADSFESVTETLRELVPTADGENREFLQELISLRSRHSEIQENKRSYVRKLVTKMSGTPENEIDSLFCDFYADISPLMAEENQLVTKTNDLALRVQKHLHSTAHAHEVDELREVQAAEIGNITDLAAEIAAKATLKAATALSESGMMPTPPKAESKPLTAIVEAYCENQISEGCWTEKTEAECRAIFALWVRIVGDQPVTDYGYEQHREYKAKLSKLPPNLNKNPLYRCKSIDEVLAMGEEPAAPNTINKNLVRIAALFEWATKYGYTTLNPARGMTIRNPKRANEERKVFSDADLERLFNPPDSVRARLKHPYQRWVPLIALFTGARLNEICQLHLNDFEISGEVPVIRISDEGGNKRVKTKAARRLIPIHSKLIEAGLLAYIEELRGNGHNRLFPELRAGRDGYGQVVSKWFARYSEQCSITEEGKVFHSFRHTVINRLKQTEVAKEKIAALVGHEEGSVTFGRYGKEFSPTVMLPVIQLLPWDFTPPQVSNDGLS